MEYYRQFPAAILRLRVRSIVLLTRPPLTLAGAYDLHALATPPAFNLSQDQTLQLKSVVPAPCGRGFIQWRVCLFDPSCAPSCDGRAGGRSDGTLSCGENPAAAGPAKGRQYADNSS